MRTRARLLLSLIGSCALVGCGDPESGTVDLVLFDGLRTVDANAFLNPTVAVVFAHGSDAAIPARIGYSISGPSAPAPSAHYSLSTDAASLSDTFMGSNSVAPTQTYVLPGTLPGSATLLAVVDAPVSGERDVAVVSYASLHAGCTAASVDGAGVSFTTSGQATPQPTIAASDVYWTGPDCPAPFQTASGTKSILHFPSGAVLFPNGDRSDASPVDDSPRGIAFWQVASSRFQSQYTELDTAQLQALTVCDRDCGTVLTDQVILLRTLDGRYAKLLLTASAATGELVGAYAVSDSAGHFAF